MNPWADSDVLDVHVEAAFGADLTDPASWTWAELVDGAGVQLALEQPLIRRWGRANESSAVAPTSLAVTLDNPAGTLTPGNVASPYYPGVTEDTPLRVWVPGTPHLAMGGLLADTPDGAVAAGVNPAPGDLWVALEVTSRGLGSQVYAASPGSWVVTDDQGDLVWLRWYDGAAWQAQGIRVGWARRRRLAVHLDVDDGAGGHIVTVYTSPGWGEPWGAPRSATRPGTTSIAAGVDVCVGNGSGLGPGLDLGPLHAPARVWHFEARDGDETGTLLASLDPTALTPGDDAWTDDQGNDWVLTGTGEVSEREVRFVGQLTDIRPYWDGDLPHGEPLVDLSASGILSSLRWGSRAVESALARIITAGGPVAYWPMEDASGATSAASGVGGPPATVAGLSFAADETVVGSKPLPVAGSGASIMGQVTSWTAGFGGAWTTTFLYLADSPPSGTYRQVLEVLVTPGLGLAALGINRWTVEYATGLARVRGYAAGGALFVDSEIGIGDDLFDGAQWLQFQVVTGAVTAEWQLAWFNIGGFVGAVSDTYVGQAGQVAAVRVGPLDGWAVGHVAVVDRELDPDGFVAVFPSHAFAGESTAARLERLAGQVDVELALRGKTYIGIEHTTLLGPQDTGPLLDVMDEAATADLGILAEQVDRLGLVYRSHWALLNQDPLLTLDASSGEVVQPFAPARNTQRFHNSVTADRPGGSSYQLRGVTWSPRRNYDDTVTVNVYDDDQLPDQAGWRLHVGEWPGMRYEKVALNLRDRPDLIDAYLELEAGDRIQIVGLPSEHPAGVVDLIVEGGVETLSSYEWGAVLTCSPSGPWTVWTYLDDLYGRLDSAHTTLAEDIDDTQSTFDVAIAGMAGWTDVDGPFDVRIRGERDLVGGEVVTVTEITGSAPTQTFTVVRADTPFAHPAGARVRLAAHAAMTF